MMIMRLAILLIAGVTAAGGVFLAQFAEADDSPGGVVIAIVVIIGAVVLAAIGLKRNAGSRPNV
jgi:hypothetical protein